MEKLILVAFFCLLNSLCFSQMTIKGIKNGHYGTPVERAKQIDDAMAKGLQLTPQQVYNVKEINLRYSWRIENEVVKTQMSDWSRYNKISAIQTDKDKEFKNVLTAEQFKKYKKKRDDMFWQGVKDYFF